MSDITGLGLIMVKAVTAKAKAASNRIEELLHGKVDPKQKVALESCAGHYKTILEADVPQATEALQKGDPKFAVDGANDAANEATTCEEDLSAAGKSPLTEYNNAAHDVATVTAAIARQLL